MPPVPEDLSRALSARYGIERELGRGGMATVYLARDLKHARAVALKVLDPELAAAIGPARFLREIEIAARLTHPHILPLHDSGAAGGHLYYVTPYIEGDSLRARLARERQLPLEDALRLTREIASALGYAHQQGLVHRDIKPENVLLSDGLALVADFGIARPLAAAGGGALTTAGAAMGTPAYMAPEQALGSAGVDGRADLYSLGCVLYEMLAGSPPFTGAPESLAYQHIHTAARPVTDVRPTVPAGVAAVLARVLAKLPADRYDSAARFAEALATAAAGGAPAGGAPGRAAPHNLPAERTHFIGREEDLAECRRSLEDARLVTLTGIGGCGKTRLALKLAESLLADHPDGVWFVDLAPITDGERVAEAVAATLGVKEVAGESTVRTLTRHLEGKRVLLLLDNCEHLRVSCAALADALLGAARGLRILATSREGLGPAGERLYALRSLAVPSAEASRDPQAVMACDAARLFVDRASLALRGFELTAANAGAVAEICRRLDGIPLALELAASRVRVLSVDQIRDRLDDRFRLLTGGSAGALPRHQTLRATIQWSYDTLAPEEQRLFRLLSVFAGGWTLESAARVAGNADEFETLELLSRLVDKSLVVVERRPGVEPRYGLLETVRQYARECLAQAGEAGDARRRHLAEYLALAERAYPERLTHEDRWCAVLEAEHDNLSAALGAAREADPEALLQLAGALAWFWQARSHLLAGREWLAGALAAAAPDPPRPARARALWGIANTLAWLGDGAAALPRMEEALRLWRALGDQGEVALALEGIGWVRLLGGDDAAAFETFRECLRLQEERGDPVLVNRARLAMGQVLVVLHRVAEARPMASQIIAFSKPRGDRRSEHLGWHYLADCALIEGKCGESLDLYREALRHARAIGDRIEIGFEIQGMAMSLAGLGDPARALRLTGASRAEWERIGVDLHLRFWDELLERYLGAARREVGEEEAARAEREGRGIPFEEAIREALEARSPAGS